MARAASGDFFAANTAMYNRLAAGSVRLTASAQRSLETGLAWSLAAVTVVAVLGLVVAVGLIPA